MQKSDLKEFFYRTTKAPVVIGGKFYRGNKEYYWENSKLLSIHVGDLVLVQNRGSISIVKVTSVYDEWNWSDEELSKSVIQNYTVDQEPWRLDIGLLNYLGVPLDDGVQFWQNVKTNNFAYQYKNGEIIPMKDYQSLTFDALGWINEVLTKEA